jgi:hypothetical protein
MGMNITETLTKPKDFFSPLPSVEIGAAKFRRLMDSVLDNSRTETPLPDLITDAIYRATQFDPQKRFSSAKEFADELRKGIAELRGQKPPNKELPAAHP